MNLIVTIAAVAAALLLAGCGHDGYAGHMGPNHWAQHRIGPRPVVGAAVYGGPSSWRGRRAVEPNVVEPDDCMGPNRVYNEEAGGCVVRITDRAELERISPRIPIGRDPKCTGNPGYWTTEGGPYGPISVHRTCVYRH